MINIGIIGQKEVIIKYYNSLKKISGVKVIGIYSRYDNCEDICSNELVCFQNFKDLLDSCDSILFTKGHSNNYNLIDSAIKNSKNLYLHPTIFASIDQISHSIKLASEANIVLHVERPLRNHAGLSDIINQLHNTRAIKIVHCIPPDQPNWSDSILSSMLSNLDIINTVVQSNIKNIRASGHNIIDENLQLVDTWLEYDDGKVATIYCSKISIEAIHTGTFIQKDKIISIDFLKNCVSILKPNKDFSSSKNIFLNSSQWKTEETDPVIDELIYFIYSIINNSRIISNYEENFKSIFLAKKIMSKLERVMVI